MPRLLHSLLLSLFLISATAGSALALKVYEPDRRPPKEGWPILVYLKGYGVTQDAFNRLVEIANDQDLVVVTFHVASGSYKRTGPKWTAIIDQAHAGVQANLASLRDNPKYDLSTVHLVGYGQGASHAALAVLRYPGHYGGALAVSPVRTEYPRDWDTSGRHPLFLMYSSDEAKEGTHLTEIRDLWRSSGGRLREHEYPGTRGDYKGWPAVVRSGLSWIVQYYNKRYRVEIKGSQAGMSNW